MKSGGRGEAAFSPASFLSGKAQGVFPVEQENKNNVEEKPSLGLLHSRPI